MPKQNDSIDFWGSGEGIGMRLEMLGGSINTGSYNNALQVLAPVVWRSVLQDVRSAT